MDKFQDFNGVGDRDFLPFQNVAKAWDVDKFKTVEFGSPGTLLHRTIFIDKLSAREVSPLHGISLYRFEDHINFVCTTPRSSWLCMEVAENEPLNPLRIQAKEDLPSHYKENSPYNIGFLPQTWGDAELASEEYGFLPYESSPLEVIDISTRNPQIGDIYAVKPLAAMAVVERTHEIAWKIIVIDVEDSISAGLDDLYDIQRTSPGLMSDIREWLKTCKCSEPGDMPRAFGLNGRPQAKEVALRVIAQTHGSWQLLQDQLGEDHAQEPSTPNAYERKWHRYTRTLNTACIPLANEVKERAPRILTRTILRNMGARRVVSENSKNPDVEERKSGPLSGLGKAMSRSKLAELDELRNSADGSVSARDQPPSALVQTRSGELRFRDQPPEVIMAIPVTDDETDDEGDMYKKPKPLNILPRTKSLAKLTTLKIPMKEDDEEDWKPDYRRSKSIGSNKTREADPLDDDGDEAEDSTWIATYESTNLSRRTMVLTKSPRTPRTPRTPKTPRTPGTPRTPRKDDMGLRTGPQIQIQAPSGLLPKPHARAASRKDADRAAVSKSAEYKFHGAKLLDEKSGRPHHLRSADSMWEEALRQFSLTLGKPVHLELSQEDKASLEWEFSSQDSGFSVFTEKIMSSYAQLQR